jgi:hypothetical protein
MAPAGIGTEPSQSARNNETQGTIHTGNDANFRQLSAMGPVSVGAAALSGSMDHGSIATRFALGGTGVGPSTSALAIALTVGILVVTLLGTAWFVLAQFSHGGRGADDDDANPGPGGGGSGRPPNGPSGPTTEPEWWADFERQFAAYVRGPYEKTEALAVHGERTAPVP